jgi:hypothetical protein
VVFGVTTHVPAPLEMYDAIHSGLLARSGAEVDGLLVHLARATPEGFAVTEVWESREHRDRYDRELVGPLVAELAGPDGASVAADQRTEEFEVRGLVVPRGGISF